MADEKVFKANKMLPENNEVEITLSFNMNISLCAILFDLAV